MKGLGSRLAHTLAGWKGASALWWKLVIYLLGLTEYWHTQKWKHGWISYVVRSPDCMGALGTKPTHDNSVSCNETSGCELYWDYLPGYVPVSKPRPTIKCVDKLSKHNQIGSSTAYVWSAIDNIIMYTCIPRRHFGRTDWHLVRQVLQINVWCQTVISSTACQFVYHTYWESDPQRFGELLVNTHEEAAAKSQALLFSSYKAHSKCVVHKIGSSQQVMWTVKVSRAYVYPLLRYGRESSS